jgi:hypothetical protein
MNERFKIAQGTTQERFDQARQDKLDEKREQKKQKFASQIGGDIEIAERFNNIEASLGDSLENLKDKKAVNLPGVNIPLIGRVTSFSAKARDLDSDIAGIFNSVLKIRSGSAVTDTELKRLRGEFEDGKWNTEQELVKGLAKVKSLAQQVLKSKEAAFPKDVIQEYRENEGPTYKDLYPEMPKQKAKEETKPAPTGGVTAASLRERIKKAKGE